MSMPALRAAISVIGRSGANAKRDAPQRLLDAANAGATFAPTAISSCARFSSIPRSPVRGGRSDVRISRNPLVGSRSNADLGMSCPTRNGASVHAPPRVMRDSASAGLAVHSRTFPDMSYTPSVFIARFRPTGRGPAVPRLLRGVTRKLSSRVYSPA